MLVAHPHFRLLAALQALAGLAIIPFLILTPSPENLVPGACAAAWLLLAGVNWLFGDRILPARAFEASLFASALVLSTHTAYTPRLQMQVLAGLELMVLGLFAAFALTPVRVNVWLGFAGLLYLIALFVNPLPIGEWLGPVIVIMVAGTTTVVGRLLKQVRDVSRHDPLTGALNRWGLADQSALITAMSERTGARVSVAFIDLDGFKKYNDTHGHLAGDRLLMELVDALGRNLRATDLVARVGGDEFVLVLPGVNSKQAERVLARIRETLPISVTYGVVDWSTGDELADVIDIADQVMYERKRRLRNPQPCDDASESH